MLGSPRWVTDCGPIAKYISIISGSAWFNSWCPLTDLLIQELMEMQITETKRVAVPMIEHGDFFFSFLLFFFLFLSFPFIFLIFYSFLILDFI